MRRHSRIVPGIVLSAAVGFIVAAAPQPALAGRGSSPGAIRSAIASGSVDAISSELERAEHLVCGVCVDLVRPLIDHTDARVRQVAAWWLARRAVRNGVSAEMVARLEGSDTVAARNAADVLGEMRSPKSIAPLGQALLAAQLGPEARAAAARALGAIGDPSARTLLEQGFAAPEADVRAASVAALRSLRDQPDARAAVPLLLDAAENVRIEAIYTVGATRTRDGAENLVELLERDSNPIVRKKAAWALGEMGAPASVAGPALQKAATSDQSPLVRSLAGAAITRLSR